MCKSKGEELFQLITAKVTGIDCYFHPQVDDNYTVVLTKSDSDVILCLQLLSKTLTC